ncbi:141_t:CDS:2 [Racocetra fulgida]|uniref:141_t:CDS:1 n=1 Tax=Racocetra fulgida TaxID=60492 RepID=A0A9N8VJN4_9GLOM|nr:141_t:CDS:2 [Racocetra fulgida]
MKEEILQIGKSESKDVKNGDENAIVVRKMNSKKGKIDSKEVAVVKKWDTVIKQHKRSNADVEQSIYSETIRIKIESDKVMNKRSMKNGTLAIACCSVERGRSGNVT